MKSLAALAPHYAGAAHTLAHGLRITRTDGEVFAFTSGDVPVTIDGTTYTSAPGLDVSSVVHSSGLAVDNLELTILPDADEAAFTRLSIMERRWDHAEFLLFEFNQLFPTDGINIIKRGRIGEIRIHGDRYVAELRGLSQALQQPVGHLASITCRARLFDQDCRLDPDDWRQSSTLTDVISNQVVRCSLLGLPEDWAGEGTLTMTSGLNAGLSFKVREHAADGTLTLAVPALQVFSVGDSFDLLPGCRKRLMEDCKGKFNNVLNNDSEPHIKNIDHLMAPPRGTG